MVIRRKRAAHGLVLDDRVGAAGARKIERLVRRHQSQRTTRDFRSKARNGNVRRAGLEKDVGVDLVRADEKIVAHGYRREPLQLGTGEDRASRVLRIA
jgi:hypothetical protein